MSPEHLESEYTFRPPSQVGVPDLLDVDGIVSADAWRVLDHEAIYFDTEDLALARALVTLRRRTGGVDDGWHLKVPTADGDDRTEIQVSLGRAVRTPPKPLRVAATPWTRGAPLVPVATVRTRRRLQVLRSTGDVAAAELCDDQVEGLSQLPGSSGEPVRWTEWELELVGAPETLTRRLLATLGEAAGAPNTGASKLARTLGDRWPKPPSEVEQAARSGRDASARAVVAARLRDQVRLLKIHDSEIRRDVGDGVHQARVSMRRLRSCLATFRPLLNRLRTDPIRDELQWVGMLLSPVRDFEVLRSRFRAALEEQPVELVVGSVRDRLDDECRAARSEARQVALETLDSPRYFQLLADLDDLVDGLAWSDAPDEPADAFMARRIRREWRRTLLRVELADAAPGAARARRLHEVRKAAKRLRYAAETAVPVLGKDAKRLVTRAKAIQTTLGEHQDSVVARQVLREVAMRAYLDGDNTFTYGRLHGLEDLRAARSLTEFEQAWVRLEKAARRYPRR